MKNTKKWINNILAFLFILLLFFININSVLAANSLWSSQSGMGESQEIGKAFNTNGTNADLRTLVVNIIKVLLSLLALFFTILIIMAGFRWMNSRGNEDEVTKAKSQLKNAIIGIIIIIAAYAITIFVIKMSESMLKGEV